MPDRHQVGHLQRRQPLQLSCGWRQRHHGSGIRTVRHRQGTFHRAQHVGMHQDQIGRMPAHVGMRQRQHRWRPRRLQLSDRFGQASLQVILFPLKSQRERHQCGAEQHGHKARRRAHRSAITLRLHQMLHTIQQHATAGCQQQRSTLLVRLPSSANAVTKACRLPPLTESANSSQQITSSVAAGMICGAASSNHHRVSKGHRASATRTVMPNR